MSIRSPVRAAIMATLLVSLVVSPVTAAGPVGPEIAISPKPAGVADRSREPILAAHPSDPAKLAVAYVRGDRYPRVVLAISHDGGRTWRPTRVPPGGGGGNHPVVAWGPGPGGGARLYYMAMTGASGRYHFAISYSDDEGVRWSRPFVSRSTRPWWGGFPDLAVDTDLASPGYGTLWAVYNWPRDPVRGPGMHVLASRDYGRTFAETELPPAPAPAGARASWRIGYRIATAPDGSAYAAAYQADLRGWSQEHPFAIGGAANVRRIGFTVTRLSLGRAGIERGPTVLAGSVPYSDWNLPRLAGERNLALTDPSFSLGLDAAPASGRLFLAVAVERTVRVYRSSDRGVSWSAADLPAMAPISGRAQGLLRPDLVATADGLVVTAHPVDLAGSARTVGSAWAHSEDDGRTWSRPVAATPIRWVAGPVMAVYNGVGLRERIVELAGGRGLFWAYGDGRSGTSAIYGRRLSLSGDSPASFAPAVGS